MRPNLINRLKEEWNNLDPVDPLRGLLSDAIDALAEQPAQQEPVAYRVKWPAIGGGYKWLMVDKPLMEKEGFTNEALYTSPQAQRKPLTFSKLCDIEYEITHRDGDFSVLKFARAIEAAHGIKENT